MEEVAHDQERSPFNLRTNFEATREAMAFVERGGWLNSNQRTADHWDEASDGEKETSLEGARRWLVRVEPDEGGHFTIYGDGGVNRWYVYADGRIRLNRSLASPDGLRRAQEKGFWIE